MKILRKQVFTFFLGVISFSAAYGSHNVFDLISEVTTASSSSQASSSQASSFESEINHTRERLAYILTRPPRSTFVAEKKALEKRLQDILYEIVANAEHVTDPLSDLEIARALQEQEDALFAHLDDHVPAIVMSDSDMQFYKNMTQALRIANDSDVHALTKSAGANYATIKRLEQTYLGYTSCLKAQDLLDGRERFLNDLAGPDFIAFFSPPPQGCTAVQMQIALEFAAHEKNAKALIEQNKGFWNIGVQDIDAETGQSLREVFAHAYQAACYLDNIRGDMEYRGYFCLQLSDNYAYNGGCHPGITGRLIELYRQILAIGLGE